MNRALKADEGAFCACGQPLLRRTGVCLIGHPIPLRVLVRQGHRRPVWVELDELLKARPA